VTNTHSLSNIGLFSSLFFLVFLLFAFLFYRQRQQRIQATTFKDGTKSSNKVKFVNIEDLDVAAIEQAVEDEELELSTQRRDSDDEADGDEKKRKRRKEVRPKELSSPAASPGDRSAESPSRPHEIELSGRNNDQVTPQKHSFSDLPTTRLIEPTSVDSSLSLTPTPPTHPLEGGQTPETMSPQLKLGKPSEFARLRGRTEEELTTPEQHTPLISR